LPTWSCSRLFGVEPAHPAHSAGDRHPDGLANSSGLVGRNVTAHITFSAFALFDEDVQNHMGMSSAFGMCQDGYPRTVTRVSAATPGP